jgi:hypothetical protein
MLLVILKEENNKILLFKEISEDFEVRLGPRPRATITTREPRIKSIHNKTRIIILFH